MIDSPVYTKTTFFSLLSMSVQYGMLLFYKKYPAQINTNSNDAGTWRWDSFAFIPASEFDKLAQEYMGNKISSEEYLSTHVQGGSTLEDFARAIDLVNKLDPEYFVGWN